MHQNTFLTTPDIKKYIFYELDSGGLEVCANALKTFLTTPDIKKNFFLWLDSGGLEMHKNTFLTTPYVKK